jgi:hypothetical protein
VLLGSRTEPIGAGSPGISAAPPPGVVAGEITIATKATCAGSTGVCWNAAGRLIVAATSTWPLGGGGLIIVRPS